VLMAGDIMLYKAELVPVGEDQSAHLELTREVVRRFNHFFGEVFQEPQTILTKTPKIPGTDGRKMSKSYGNAINIADDPEEIWEKLRTMVTDTARERRSDPGNPDKCPVWDLHKAFNHDMEQRAYIDKGCRTAGIGCIECKQALYSHLMAILEPIQSRRRAFEANEEDLLEVLKKGAMKAEKVSEVTIEEVIKAIGFISR